MKKSKHVSFGIPMLAALVATLIAIPLRVYQYYKIIDPDTGFYNEIDFSVYLMYALLGIAMVVSIVVPFISHKSLKPVYIAKKRIGLLISCVIMAAGAVADSVSQFISYSKLFSVDLSASGQQINEYISNQGGNLLLAQAVFGMIVAIFFIVYGFTSGAAGSDGSKLKILALLPVIWCIFRLLYRFKRTISFVNVSDLMLELFLIVFAMMYFLAYAQVITRIDAESVYWKIFAYGIPAIMFALVCFVSRFIITIVGNGDLLSEHYGIHYSDITFVIFAAYSLITRSGIKTKKA